MANLLRTNSEARLRSMVVVILATCCLLGSVSTPRIAQAAALQETLFEQPSLDGIAGNFFVPPAAHKPPPVGVFSLILWQPNPNRADGMLVPTQWAAGAKTGFYPSTPVDKHQSGFRDTPGTTTVQADGDTVGAYINSADLPAGSHKDKMMITPQYRVAPGGRVRPFGQSGYAILISLELQIPTALDAHSAGSETYVTADLAFMDPNRHTKISYGCNLFHNGHPRGPGGHVRLDTDSQNMMINSAVVSGNEWLTLQRGSAVGQSAPWKGWKVFAFAITEKNFEAGLRALRDSIPTASINPADYEFVAFHLNAELHFSDAPAQLGWSMRHVKIVAAPL